MKNNTTFIYIAWCWVLLVLLASFVPRPQSVVRQFLRKLLGIVNRGDIDKQVHLLFYFILVFLFSLAYKSIKSRTIIVLIAIFISGIVEYLQPLFTNGSRRADKVDFIYNISGGAMGLIAAILIEFMFNKFQKICIKY